MSVNISYKLQYMQTHLLACKPKSKEVCSNEEDLNRGFELAPNGKLIIREDKMDNDKYKQSFYK